MEQDLSKTEKDQRQDEMVMKEAEVGDEATATLDTEYLEARSDHGEPPVKRVKMDRVEANDSKVRQKGIAAIKPEFLLHLNGVKPQASSVVDDDAAEAQDSRNQPKNQRRERNRGQNKGRDFGSSKDERGLCASRVRSAEFSPRECQYGEGCKFEHDLRKYLQEWKREDLTTFGGICPIWQVKGKCEMGWKCRFVASHSKEVELSDGRKELILTDQAANAPGVHETEEGGDLGVVNMVSTQAKISLVKRKMPTPQADLYSKWLEIAAQEKNESFQRKQLDSTTEEAIAETTTGEATLGDATTGHATAGDGATDDAAGDVATEKPARRKAIIQQAGNRENAAEITNRMPANEEEGEEGGEEKAENAENAEDEATHQRKTHSHFHTQDRRAQFVDPPLLPSEKRRLYFGPETPVLAPLTTQGNIPFRRLCVSLGAQVTYSEMAMSSTLLQGVKSEWALMKAHESEMRPPTCHSATSTIPGYINSQDIRFGAQIAGSRPPEVLRATEVLTTLCPHLRLIDLNCGCPIDVVYRRGAGSALLDTHSKLDKMLRGMNAVSKDVPITVKIRMGTRDNHPTALKLINRLVHGAHEGHGGSIIEQSDPAGIAAITLHGRSRQQRYTRSADWTYIAECAALIQAHKQHTDAVADTIGEPDARLQSANARPYFIGNGDVYSHEAYRSHLALAGVDAVMIARGALIKPWIFEEIAAGQYLDKTATERLTLVEQYARYGLETWGSDERGVGTTRRFLLEWLSFAHRYVPVAMLEHLPPSLQDRPMAWRGRNELETLLGSDDYQDWIKIR